MAAPGTRRHRLLALATTLATALVAASAAEAAAPSAWMSAAPMAQGHSGHVAAALPDGDVLVAGGGIASPAGAERYDSATGGWTSLPPMSAPRYSAAAAALGDGRVLVTGGVYMATNSSADIFDPATDTWSPAAPMSTPRSEHALVALPDGRVLAVGGNDGGSTLSSAEIYDPATDSWTPAASLAAPRNRLTVTLLSDGTALAVGGFGASGSTTSVERYDPATDDWRPAAALPSPRMNHTATLLRDGTLLVAGGINGMESQPRAERYDPEADAWVFAGDMADAPYYGAASRLPNGSVLVTGGPDQIAEVYDPASDNWLPAGSPPARHTSHTSTLLPDGSVLLAGGALAGGSTTGVSRFQLVTGASSPAVELGEQSVGQTATAIVPVRNDGYAPLFTTGAAFAGPAGGDFAIRHNGCAADGAIGRRETCLVFVAFKPSAAGTRAATLVLEVNTTSGRIEVPISGTGIAPPRPATAPRSAGPPSLRCVKGRAGRVVCSGAAHATKARAASVRLVRRGNVFAVGRIDARGKLRLKPRRALLLRRYELRIAAGAHRGRLVVEIASVGR